MSNYYSEKKQAYLSPLSSVYVAKYNILNKLNQNIEVTLEDYYDYIIKNEQLRHFILQDFSMEKLLKKN